LQEKKYFRLPLIPTYASNNAHLFYILCNTGNDRDKLITYLKKQGILAVFHYQSLHKSSYFTYRFSPRSLPHCDNYSDCLLRLPLYYELTKEEVSFIVKQIREFYELSLHAR
jgi:dTDP-4-amino-4,6-dideoxygalactose transaminase